ncbi:MAG: class I SAM-dependent methyltransferase [Gaiellales bacterium]
MDERTWDDEAENWVRWARTPAHDSYWYFSPGFFEAIVPPAGGRTLEIGCGEGRVVRDLASRGHSVVGIDASPEMLRHAREADPGGEYVRCDAAQLPFADESFDLAVAYNSLMDVDDLPGTIAEAARVLEPGGALCICVTHPINDAGLFASREPDAEFVITDRYFDRRRFDASFERAGLNMTFHSWRSPLSAYTRPLEEHGLVIERVREPPAPDSWAKRLPSEVRWQLLPLFLWLRARKLHAG